MDFEGVLQLGVVFVVVVVVVDGVVLRQVWCHLCRVAAYDVPATESSSSAAAAAICSTFELEVEQVDG